MTGVLLKGKCGHNYTHKGERHVQPQKAQGTMRGEDRGRDGSDVSKSQRDSKDGWQPLGARSMEYSRSESAEETNPPNTLIPCQSSRFHTWV